MFASASGRLLSLALVLLQLLVCCLLVLVLQGSIRPIEAFREGLVYEYEFEGAIASKVAGAAEQTSARIQYSGLALNSKLQVMKSGKNELVVQLNEPKASVFNEPMSEIHLHNFDFKPMAAEEGAANERRLVEGLDRPFRIYFEDGSVRSFDSHKNEPKWVTNFKRGLLSFFQLKLSADQSGGGGGGGRDGTAGGAPGGVGALLGADGGRLATGGGGGQYYTTPEKSVFGDCETDYLVMEKDSEASLEAQLGSDYDYQQPAFSVTKTRNMARCKSRFRHRFTPIESDECFDNDKDLHSNAIFQYDLVGTRQDYAIKRVLLDETSTFSPFGQRAHSHQVNTKFMLQFRNVWRSLERPRDVPEVDELSSVRLESLSYDPPEMLNFYANVNLDNEHHLSSIYQTTASVEQVMQALEALVDEHRAYAAAFDSAGEPMSAAGDGVASSATLERSRLAELFLRVNELVGTLNLAKIEQLYVQVDKRGEQYKKLFWDLMSVAGTNPSFVFMKRLITEGDAPSVKIKDYLTRLSYHIKMPSKQLFDEYVNLCKSDKIQTDQQYTRLCSLPLASLIHQHCAKPHARYLRLQSEGANATGYKKAQNTCQIATAEEYFTRLIAPFVPAGRTSLAGSGSNTTASSLGAGAASSAGVDASSLNSVGGVGGGGAAIGASGGGGAGLASGAGSPSDELSTGEKMFNIKMAGELGVRASVDFLLDIVAARDEHPSLRAAAMWNLLKPARIYPNLVKRAVVPFYYDSNELLEVRLAAFHNWLATGLTQHEMHTMAKRLLMEPSRQLVVYVSSLIDSMASVQSSAESAPTLSCVAAASGTNNKLARLVLPTVKKALARHLSPTWTDSRATTSAYFNTDYGYGQSSLMSIIFSNESMAPTNLYYSSSETMSGFRFASLTVSVQAHGLDKLLKRVIGVNGLLADKESFMDVFSLKRRSRRQTDQLIKQEANEIDKELAISVRDFSDIYLVVTTSAYGRPISFFERDSRELKKMLGDDGTVKVPQIKKLLHSFNNHTSQQMMVNIESLEVFNNELGLPLFLSISDFEYKTFRLNSVKLDVEPGFFRDERQGKPPTRISAALDSKLGRHKEMFVSTGALVAHLRQQVGVGLHKRKVVNLPIRFGLEANLAESRLSLRLNPLHNSLVYVKQTPLTFAKTYDPSRPVRPSGSNVDADRAPQTTATAPEWLPLFATNNSAQMQNFSADYMTPLAVGLKLTGKHRAGEDWSAAAWRRYLAAAGYQAANFAYKYSPSGAPLEARLSLVTTDENPTRELVANFTWRHHHTEPATNSATSGARAETRRNEIERELEATTTRRANGVERAPTTVGYRLALIGGSERERNVSLDLAYSRSFDRLVHKWRLFYQRTPMGRSTSASTPSAYADADAAAGTNMCWLGTAQFSPLELKRMLELNMSEIVRASANATSDFSFGAECSEAAARNAPENAGRLAASLELRPSADQLDAIATAFGELRNELEPSNAYSRLLQRCRRQLPSPSPQAAAAASEPLRLERTCLDAIERMGELTAARAEFEFANVPERFSRLVSKLGSLYTYARAGYIDELDETATRTAANNNNNNNTSRPYKSPDGRFERAYLDANITHFGQVSLLEPNERKLSYTLDAPNYHVVYRNVPLRVGPVRSFAPFGSANWYQPAESVCLIRAQNVRTFDNMNFTMPQVSDGCFKLVAKDCSPEENYVVLGANVAGGKVVKVYIAQKFKIEFVPDKNGQRVSDIKVNGLTIQLADADSQPIELYRRETQLGSRLVEAFKIDFNGAFYTLSSRLYRFSVSTDGTFIMVRQSRYYAGKSCGICGDADGDQQHEFKSPSSARRVCRNANDFVWSHVLPSTCASRPAVIGCA